MSRDETVNVASLLTPKSEVAWISQRATLRVAIDHLERHGYTAVPVLDDEGGYAGTLTEGDLLRKLTHGAVFRSPKRTGSPLATCRVG